jgi:hypothetical protein
MGLLITNGEFTAFRDPKGIGHPFVDPSVVCFVSILVHFEETPGPEDRYSYMIVCRGRRTPHRS